MKNLTKVLLISILVFTIYGMAFSTTVSNKSENDNALDFKPTPTLAGSAALGAIGGYNVYYGHLHNHSNVSDGTGTPNDAYNYAKNIAGLDFFGLSDHANQIDANEWISIKSAADNYNLDGVFTTFRGFEWSHNTQGHVTIINTEDYCTASSVPNFTNLLSWISTRDCAAFLNHPGRQNTTGQEFGQFTDTPSDKIVGMELWNKNDAYSVYYYNDGYHSKDELLGYFDEAHIRDWKIGAGGSSDNHTATWGTDNDYRMAILAENLSRTSLYEAMQNKRFFSTLDKNIKMSFKINGSEMGSTIAGNVGQNLQILVSDDDGEIFTKIELFKNGKVVNTWSPGVSDVTIAESLTTLDGDFYYIKVMQVDNDEAISSPVFIEGGLINTPPVCSITNPKDATHYNSTQTILISADATDSDGTISTVEFFVNGLSVGTDNTLPYTTDWPIPANGAYSIFAKASDNLGSTTNSSTVYITVGEYTQMISAQISSGNDDVEESSTGIMYISSTDIELVYDEYNSAGNQTVGLRFSGLGIPQGVIITSANIQFTTDEVTAYGDASNLSVFGHSSDNSPQFTSVDGDVSGRAKTNSSVNWSPPEWNTLNEAGTEQQTPDLSTIIQELVNRPGFSSASAISIIFTGTGRRNAHAYEGAPGLAAILNVEYSMSHNTPPVFSANPIVEIDATEDVDYSGSITDKASDSDGDNLTFSKISGPVWLSINENGNLSGTPLNENVGLNNWIIQVNDGNGGTAQATLQITVINTNDSPVFNSDQIIKPDGIVSVSYIGTISGSATDVDNDELTYSLISGPVWLIMSPDGNLSGTPLVEGTYIWQIKVNDNFGGTDIANLEIKILDPTTVSYCSSYSPDYSREYISSVTIGSFVNNSSGSAYSDFTSSLINLEAAQNYTIALTPAFSGKTRREYFRVWIDFNLDGDFYDSGELVFEATGIKSTATGTLSIPANISGNRRMRVSMKYNAIPDPCEVILNGEVEDYTIQIGTPVVYTPIADFYADKTNVNVGESIQFTDNSTNIPTSWSWNFPGGTPSSSSIQNPVITFSSVGTYTASLTVENSAGSDTEIKTGYITVTQPVIEIPVADFMADKTIVFTNELIQFSDVSTNNPTSWSWNFGDGQNSTVQNPSNIYNSPGIYPVTLEASNSFGTGTLTKTDYITVSAAPVGTYCEPFNINNSIDYIDEISINGIVNQSHKNTSGFTLFETPVFNFVAGGSYPVTLQPFNDNNRNFWRIWIDANADGDYEDANETLFSANNKKGLVSGNITVPSDITATITRLRISMKTGSSPSSCDDNFSGELEDYNVNVTYNIKSATIHSPAIIPLEQEDISFNIYPNPTSGKLYVRFNGWEGKKEIRLYEITGKLVFIKNITNQLIEIDVSAFPKGIYLLDVNNGIYREHKKISIK